MRFVSTPEILERFIGLEKEIIQIESSLEAYDLDIAHVAGQGDGGVFMIQCLLVFGQS